MAISLQAFAKFENGEGRTVLTVRDDAQGRREVDQIGFEYANRADVVRVTVERVTRTAGYGR